MTFGMVCSVALAFTLTSLCSLGIVFLVIRSHTALTRALMEANRELLRNTWAAQTAETGHGGEAASLVQSSAYAATLTPMQRERQRQEILAARDESMLGI